MRSTLGTLRMRFNFPTRRKRERPESVEIGTIDAKGRTGRAKVPIDEYPVGVALPHFGRAGLFLGSIPELDTLQHVARSFYLNGDMDGFREKYHWDGVLQFRWMPVEFGQYLIKMCYSFAVAEISLNAFRPICLPQILSLDKNISFIFGQCGMNDQVSDVSKVWDIKLFYLLHSNMKLLVVANCSIFPGAGTPVYEVVLGYVDDPDHFSDFYDRLKGGRLEIDTSGLL